MPQLNRCSSLRPTTCIFDPCPSWLIKECSRDWVPLFSRIVNASLEEGYLPAALKRAAVCPLLKQASLDPGDLGSYRPISNLPLGKVIEKVVAGFLREYLDQFDFYDRFQSGFRPGHSTESALVKVVSDLLTSLDRGLVAFLVQLDLSLAFDTIDHGVLLHRLEHLLGISGSVLSWFRSFLEGRSQVVRLGSSLSAPAEISCGVPQGSILSPMLFAIYLLPLGAIAERFGVGFHCYADDVQLYLDFPANSPGEASVLEKCLGKIRSWMAGNWLRLNQKKTEVLLVGRDRVWENLVGTLSPPSIDGGALRVVKVAKSLGVFLDASLTLERQISSVVSSGFFHLRNIRRLRLVLPRDSLSTLMHAFVSSRLDYCNALYAGLPLKAIRRLQLVQNSAARVVNNVSRFDHITPTLRELHWLLIRWQITFKVLVLVFKALNGFGPAYLRDFLTPYVLARLCVLSLGTPWWFLDSDQSWVSVPLPIRQLLLGTLSRWV
ncbi:RNA-directed DNA polymerase from mobile element jockey isoform X2 [Latimeria chalumnae]|uniref:RNA-directed DNA polymerase from mobile element jockey isoform X2 n=1 Tax=Latimeria chalumnae TaxID=7897 RepID=UPI00313F1FCE